MFHPVALYRYHIALSPPLPLHGELLHARHGLVIQARDSQGVTHYGEAAPLPSFSACTLQDVEQELLSFCRSGGAEQLTLPESQFAWHMATHPLPVSEPQNSEPQKEYPLLYGDLVQQWREWSGPRPKVIKIKAGKYSPSQLTSALELLLSVAPVKIRLDVNQQWSFSQASQFLSLLPAESRACFDYIEEPCDDSCRFGELYQRFGVSFALDESTRSPEFNYQPEPGLAALVLKPMLLGSRLFSLHQQARAANCKVILSSSYESSLGIAYLRALARQLTPDEPAGLDTLTPFASDLLIPLRQNVPLQTTESLQCLWHN